MFPKPSQSSRISFLPKKRQHGFLIPLALFIVVVMGLLALALSRTTTQTGLASAQELISLQAFYAAESGAQHGMNHLFLPLGNRAGIDSLCEGYTETLNFNGVAGLASCTAAISCECADCMVTAPASFYTLTSEGRCGSGAMSAVRTIRVGAFMDKDQEI